MNITINIPLLPIIATHCAKKTTTKKTKKWKWVELTSPPSWLTVAPSPSRTCTTFCLPYITPTCNGVKPSYVENMKNLTEYDFARQIPFIRKKQESEQRNEIPCEIDWMREIWMDNCMQCNVSLSKSITVDFQNNSNRHRILKQFKKVP